MHSFTFRGFPPRKSGARRRFLAVDQESPHTLIFYESPYRLEGLLEDALAVFGDRQAALAHETDQALRERATGQPVGIAGPGARRSSRGGSTWW